MNPEVVQASEANGFNRRRVGILGVLCASRPSILYSFNAAKVGEEVLVEQSYL